MNTGIPPEHLARLLAIFRKYPQIRDVVLYGSRAKGEYRDGSDIDIALKGTGIDKTLLALIDIDYNALYLPWKLDVCVYEDIVSADLLAHIDRVGILLLSGRATTG